MGAARHAAGIGLSSAEPDRADALVRTRGLTKRYRRGIVAVDRVDLTVRRGEVYGFLGPNGAGKTTTLRMLLGLIRSSGGNATVFGYLPGDPRGLARILDEPTNGLDPAGMADMRTLIRVGVISGGKLIAESTVQELRGTASLLLAAQPLDEAARVAGELLGPPRVQHHDGQLRLDAGSC